MLRLRFAVPSAPYLSSSFGSLSVAQDRQDRQHDGFGLNHAVAMQVVVYEPTGDGLLTLQESGFEVACQRRALFCKELCKHRIARLCIPAF